MTGNVVFLGFGLAGVGEISIVASLLAILAFAQGRKRMSDDGTWWLAFPLRDTRRATFV